MADPRLKAYGIAGAVFALDRLTKWIIETRVSVHGHAQGDPRLLRHRALQNRGVAFGIFNDSTSPWRTTLLILAAAVAAHRDRLDALARARMRTASRSGAWR